MVELTSYTSPSIFFPMPHKGKRKGVKYGPPITSGYGSTVLPIPIKWDDFPLRLSNQSCSINDEAIHYLRCDRATTHDWVDLWALFIRGTLEKASGTVRTLPQRSVHEHTIIHHQPPLVTRRIIAIKT